MGFLVLDGASGAFSKSRASIASSSFTPRSISGLALWLDAADASSTYTTDAGPVSAVSSPLDISGCLCWYDAADASSITKDGSNLVSQWNDKSGNARHATASGALRPTSGGSQNGRTVMQFTGTQAMTITGNFLQSDNVTMFAVAMKNTDHYGGIISSAPTNPEDSPILCFYLTTIAWLNRRVLVQQATANNVYRIVSGQSVGTTQQGFFDGIRGTDATASVATNTANTITKIGVLRTGSTADLNGNIAEIVCYSGNLTTAQRASVEAYLASKWAISGVHVPATATSDPVGYWADKSGNNRHAVQATAGSRPLVGTQNGRKALTFDGVNDNLKHIPTSTLGANAITFLSAVRHNLTGQPTFLCGPVDLSHSNAYRPVGRYQSTSNNWLFVGGTLANVSSAYRSQPDRFIHMLDGQRDAGGASVHAVREFFNGAVVATGSISTTWTTADQKLNIGTREDNGVQYKGDICELLVYDRLLTTAERQRAERYLAARWGITLAPTVSNADAQNWINRVYANGGTVSTATAASVNTLCDSLESASLRDRFYRLNLFCGSNLNAALVPLYRGPSLGGTQYGNATDTNVGPFVSGDYAETGATGGLKGDGTTKFLQTGFPGNTLATGNRHLSAYDSLRDTTAYKSFMGTQDDSTGTYYFSLGNASPGTSVFASFGAQASSAGHTTGGHWIGTDPASDSLVLYKNGSSVASSSSTLRQAPSGQGILVFATNQSPTTVSAGGRYAGRLGAYSIGLGMTAAQAAAYYTAMQAFQTALTRNV